MSALRLCGENSSRRGLSSVLLREMAVFDIVGLTPLLERTRGIPEIMVGLIDGPAALDHPDLAGQGIREIAGAVPAACANRDSAACAHGTFVAGMLAAKRGSIAPAICPDCTFILPYCDPFSRKQPTAKE
jgi:hypothetical protein